MTASLGRLRERGAHKECQQPLALATVGCYSHVVAEEEEIGRRRKAAHLKHSDQVRVLAVDVTDDLDRRGELDERRLREKDLAGGETDGCDLSILEGDRLGDFARVAGLEEPGNHGVDVERPRRRRVRSRVGWGRARAGGERRREDRCERKGERAGTSGEGGGTAIGGRRGRRRLRVGEDRLGGWDLAGRTDADQLTAREDKRGEMRAGDVREGEDAEG